MRPSARPFLLPGLALALLAALSACGRRGPLEPPEASVVAPAAPAAVGRAGIAADRRVRPATGAVRQQPAPPRTLGADTGISDGAGDEEEEEVDSSAVVVSPQPTVARRRNVPYTVPKEPFLLDPLL